MSQSSNFILRGETARSYNIQYAPEMVFAYISDFKVLYSNVPYTTKIQLRKNSGRARMFCTVNVLGIEAKALIDVEPQINNVERTIRIGPPAESLGPLPPGYLTGTFTSQLRIAANEKGGTRATARIALAFDTRQVEVLNYFPRSFIENGAQPLLQQRLDDLCTDYVVKLVEGYPNWQANRSE